MTDELDLDAIEARAEVATPGPWTIKRGGVRSSEWLLDPDLDGWGHIDFEADAEFIAAARSDVPALVAEVRRLQAERDEARAGYQAAVECLRAAAEAWARARARCSVAWRPWAAEETDDA